MEKLLEPYPIPPEKELMEVFFLNFSVRDYFKNICDHTSPTSFTQFLHDKGELKISSTDWVVPNPPEEYSGQAVVNGCTTNVEIQIKDNPFVKCSPTIKY